MALFIFYAMPSSAKLKDTLVHFESFIHLHNYESILYWKQFYNTLSQPRKLFSQILLFCFHSQQNCFTDWRWNMSDIASYTKTRTRGCQNEKRKTTKYHLPSPPPRKNDRSDKLERIPFILAIDITYFISSRCWYSQHFTLNLVIMKDNKTFETLWLDYGVWWWSSGQNTRLWDKTYWDRSNHNREREREHRNGF